MRVAVLALACLAVCGCSSDLFHSTTWPTVCDYDPSTPGCPVVPTDAGEDPPSDEDGSPGEDVHDDG